MPSGPYESMWLFVSSDLPTLTRQERKKSARFRKNLLDMGFSMFQLSVYSRYYNSKDIAASDSMKIRCLVPENGHVSVFYITDKQFSMIDDYYGGLRNQLEIPEAAIFIE